MYLRPMYTNKIKIRGQTIARQILDFFPHAYKLEELKEETYTDTNNLSFNNYIIIGTIAEKMIFTNKFIIRFDGDLGQLKES